MLNLPHNIKKVKFVGKFILFYFGGLLLQNWEVFFKSPMTEKIGIDGTDWSITLIMFGG